MHLWIVFLALVAAVSFATGFIAGKHVGIVASEKAWSIRVRQLSESVFELRTQVKELQKGLKPT